MMLIGFIDFVFAISFFVLCTLYNHVFQTNVIFILRYLLPLMSFCLKIVNIVFTLKAEPYFSPKYNFFLEIYSLMFP